MLPAISLDEIRSDLRWRLQQGRNVRLVGLVLCRPETKLGDEIIRSLAYFHRRSGEHTNFYFGGYLQGWADGKEVQVVTKTSEPPWIFAVEEFDNFRRELEGATTWKYSGGTDLILVNATRSLDSDLPEVDLSNAICLRLEELRASSDLIEMGMLFERIFAYAETCDGVDPAWGFSDAQGMRSVRSGLRNLLFSAMPEALKKEAQTVHQFAIRDIGRHP